MVVLSVDLQDGFVDDTVVLYANGKEFFRKKNVSTKLLLGLAQAINTEVKPGTVSIEIRVPTKNVAKTISLLVSADTYVGISLVNGMIDHIVSPGPFAYG
jgi:hypothetical protein